MHERKFYFNGAASPCKATHADCITNKLTREDEQIPGEELGSISPKHPKFKSYRDALQHVLEKQFGRLLAPFF